VDWTFTPPNQKLPEQVLTNATCPRFVPRLCFGSWHGRPGAEPRGVEIVIDEPDLVPGVILHKQVVAGVKGDLSRGAQRQLDDGVGRGFGHPYSSGGPLALARDSGPALKASQIKKGKQTRFQI